MADERLQDYQKSPIPFIGDMWGLHPLKKDEVFIKGKHISPQQLEVLLAVERSSMGEGLSRISVVSGHGIGKSSMLSWLILWFLFSYWESQVACTAPTAAQMHDVLWKELSLWISRMPPVIQTLYDHSSTHIRMAENPEGWFARARTASKENAEALAGVHAEHVMIVADEASGIPDPIFATAEGALTGENVLMIMCSNGTRSTGYFYESHHKDSKSWERFSFSSKDSPVVKDGYIQRIAEKYGEDSDDYRVRVLGLFPREDNMDRSGFVPLINQGDLKYTIEQDFAGPIKLGVDPAGEGRNTSAWVVRDRFRAVVVAQESVSTPKTIAQKTLTLMEEFGIPASSVYVDIFGVGARTVQELAISGAYVNGVNVGEAPQDPSRYCNQRAEVYFRLREWLRSGAELFNDKRWDELTTVKFRHNERGRIQIMSKQQMLASGIKSPDVADALSLTFVDEDESGVIYVPTGHESDSSFDLHDPL